MFWMISRVSESIDTGSMPDSGPERRTQLLNAAFQFIELFHTPRIELRGPGFNLRSNVKAFAVCVGNGSIGVSWRLERIFKKRGDLRLCLNTAASEGKLTRVQFSDAEQACDLSSRDIMVAQPANSGRKTRNARSQLETSHA